MAVTFAPMTQDEVTRLKDALHRNAESGGKVAITMSTGDGGFAGVTEEEMSDLEVATAIKAIPVHY